MKLPRDVSGQQAVRALQRIGFAVQRQRGSLVVTVPAHATIAPGTLQSILRQARIDVETFCQALR